MKTENPPSMQLMVQELFFYLMKKYFKGLSLFGTSFFYLIFLLFLSRIQPYQSLKALIAFAAIEIISAVTKILFPKHRPKPSQRNTLVQKYEAGSFPSIHSARITLLALLTLKIFPADSITFSTVIIIAISVGYSRIHLKRHFASDVIAGALLGLVMAKFCL